MCPDASARQAGCWIDLNKDTIPLHVDDLFGLRDCEVDRVIHVLMRIGPDEVMPLNAIGGVLLDDPGGLILTVYWVFGVGRMRYPLYSIGGAAELVEFAGPFCYTGQAVFNFVNMRRLPSGHPTGCLARPRDERAPSHSQHLPERKR